MWSSVRQEIRTALGLLWISSTSIIFDPVRQVDAGDSSSGAFALLTTFADRQEIKEVCKWREVWRYQPLAQSLKNAVESGSRSMAIAALEELGVKAWKSAPYHRRLHRVQRLERRMQIGFRNF